VANKFNNPNTGAGTIYHAAKGSPSKGSIPMKTGPFSGNIGKAGPNRQAGFGTKVKQHTQDSGL